MVNYSNIETLMQEVLKRTFQIVQYAYDNHWEDRKNNTTELSKEDSRTLLVIPQYGEDRENNKEENQVSEQLLRFAFVQAFHEYVRYNGCKFFYAAEVPTIKACGEQEKRSGDYDLVIYDAKLKRICLIELKEGNGVQKETEKDFIKLTKKEEGDENVQRYFIQLLESSNDNTINNINDKLSNVKTSLCNKPNHCMPVHYYCYSLQHGSYNNPKVWKMTFQCNMAECKLIE